MRTTDAKPERVLEIEETYRRLGLDPSAPAIRSGSELFTAPPAIVVTPLLSNNSSFD